MNKPEVSHVGLREHKAGEGWAVGRGLAAWLGSKLISLLDFSLLLIG